MNNNGVAHLISQIGYQAPMLLVYFVAFVLALVFMGRASLPSILTLLGVAVLVLTTFSVTVIQAYLIQFRGGNFAQMFGIVSIAGSCARALGHSLLVAAIFVGRRNEIGNRVEPGAAPDQCVVI